MAIEYYLEFENSNNQLSSARIVRELVPTFTLKGTAESPIMMGRHLSVSVFDRTDEHDKSLFGSPYPDVCVAFRLDKFAPDDTGELEMLAMIRWLLDNIEAQAALVDYDGTVFLRRQAEGLFLNMSQEFWTPSRVAAISR